MTIMLKKDGTLIIDPAPPLEGKDANLDNLAAFIADPADGDAIIYDATAGTWKAAKIATLPAVTAEDEGAVLTVVDGVWKAVVPETTAEDPTADVD